MRVTLLAAGAAVAALMAASPAQAAVTCANTISFPTGDGFVHRADLTPGTCVQAEDELYGNFDLGNLPTNLVLDFNLNTIGDADHHQLSFDATYKANTSYTWGYEVTIASTASPGTLMTSVDADFTQTVSSDGLEPSVAASGVSTLDKWITPTGSAHIHEVKNGAIVQPGSVLMTSYDPGVTDLVISETLQDHGTVSSVTNTVTETSSASGPPIPEPATLTLLGAGLAAFGAFRRKRRARS